MSVPQTQETVQRRRRGCLLSGCIVLVVLFLLSLVGLLVGYRIFLQTFTSRTPAHFPATQLSVPEQEAVHAKIGRFRDAVRAAQPTAPLALSAEELNAALLTEPELHPYTNMLHIAKIDDHGIEADVSVPLDRIGVHLPMARGRYVNGKATFTLSLTNGTLKIKAQELSVDGKSFPDRFMDKIRTANLASDINNDARSSPGLNRLQSIQVSDGKLIIVAPPAE